MSLMFLKTKDLSWQDRTVNVEVMLSPSRSQLLLNKHKTLTTSYGKEVDLYEKQVSSFIKDITVKKRLMERYRTKLIVRQKELLLQGSHSSQAMAKLQHLLHLYDDRTRSAPAASSQRSSTPRPEGKRSRGLFLTEIDVANIDMLPVLPSRKSKKKKKSTLMTLPSIFLQTSTERQVTKSASFLTPISSKPARVVTFGETPLPESVESGEGSQDEPEVDAVEILDAKIKTFLEEVKVFNEKPRSSLDPDVMFDHQRVSSGSSGGGSGGGGGDTGSPVVRRFSTVVIETHHLEDAFNKFCKTKSRENLTKMMRMASKMKANLVQARLNASQAVPKVDNVVGPPRTFLSLRPQIARPAFLQGQGQPDQIT